MAKVFQKSQVGQSLVDACSRFTLDLHKQLGVLENGNMFYSPLSIAVALSMTYLGARDKTASEMKSVLHFDKVDDEHLHPTFSDILSVLNEQNKSYQLHMANRLFGEKSYGFLEEFLSSCKKHYESELEAVDFRNAHEAARQEVNSWVEQQTANKIQNILPPSSVNNLTRLILVNAVYFKGDWAQKFDKMLTRDGVFHISSSDSRPTKMMYAEDDYNIGFSKDLQCQVLEMPYVENHLSMFIILPEAVDGVGNLEKILTSNHIANPEGEFRMRETKVRLTLPRFKLEQSFSLTDTLQAMGMKDLFSQGNANLAGIDGAQNLFVSKVLHKAFIEVNEEGTEAAAATAVVCMLRSAGPPRFINFTADHPFLFFIRDNRLKSVLFFGRMALPPSE